ncbi:MAG TPA: tRNA (adenosine(37)-N6)-dimethylallyltransferase MiaA [Chthonomonadaceae bacterium]|nr:tRNA (adenosine(37)-N6)-dimethylallyltransferase MiaA [Chthonomonadaceae bacterium]
MAHVWPGKHIPIVLVGPTATGKTAAAVELAERIGGEIINADSMQVYRGMDIGTAKPTPEERARVRFHLLDVVTPDQPFSVAEWKERAEAALAEIATRDRWPILCGGTGLYLRALLDDWTLAETPADPALREQLRAEVAHLGAPALHGRLCTVDPATAARLHPNDAVRIVRALEVYHATGVPISEHQARDRAARPPRPAFRLGLTLPRPQLYARIDARVEAMLAAGLEAEVRGLLAQGVSPALSPLRSLGYKEMAAFLRGEIDRATAIERIKQETRRYAKRQLTWFRAEKRLHWVDVSALSSATVATSLLEYLRTQPGGPR